MAPHKIRDMLMSDLRKVRRGFFQHDSAAAIDKMSTTERAKAGEVLLNTSIAISKLETIKLKEIADQFSQFERDLTEASEDLAKAVKDLKKFEKVINAAAKVLSLLGKIAKFVGIPLS